MILILSFFCLLVSLVPVTAITLYAGESQTLTPTIAQGDPVFIRGIATGHPQPGLQVWLIGNNHARVTTIPVESDNTFEYELKPVDTQNLAAGQYFVLIQHPMMNGQFDVTYNSGTGQVINQQLNGGTAIFSLNGAGSLQSSDASFSLIQAINSQNIDDTFSSVSFFIDQPNALIDPIGDHIVGERFMISGTTNLAVGDDIFVEVYSSSFIPTIKSQGRAFSGISGTVKVQPGLNGFNCWSFDADTSTWTPDEYIVTISAVLQDVKRSASFTVTEKRITATTVRSTAGETTGPPPSVVITVQTAPPTTQTTSIALFIVIAGPFIAFFLFCTIRDKL